MIQKSIVILLVSLLGTSLSYGQDELYNKFQTSRDSLFELQNKHNELFNKFKESDSAKSDYHSEQSNLYFDKVIDLVLDYTDKYGDLEVSKTILQENIYLFDIDYDAASKLLAILNKHENFDIKLKEDAQHRFDALKEKQMVGKIAPDFKLTDTGGKEVSLSDYKGKIVWLNFWASW